MNHLRIVKSTPVKSKRRKGTPYVRDLLSEEDQRHARQALRNLRDAFGSLSCLADASGVSHSILWSAACGRVPVTVTLLYAVAKASGLTIDDLLSAPVPADRCKACGQVKRYARAS